MFDHIIVGSGAGGATVLQYLKVVGEKMTQMDQEPSVPSIKTTDSIITSANKWDHFSARLGIRRMDHRVEPGLYALGKPTPDSPIFVTANYTLSFDALRSSLQDTDCYIMVLDTKGVNVWCAAGKGAFGTDEVVRRIEATALDRVVSHRRLILPQLSASGVCASEVKKRSGFSVNFGPIRASDIREFMIIGKATPEMRRVRFGLKDRVTLIPVEVVDTLLPMAIAALAFFLVGGLLSMAAVLTAVLAGNVLFPLLLPWIPTKDFSTKGIILGMIAALPFAVAVFMDQQGEALWLQALNSSTYLFLMAPVTSYIALNFTGSTPYTSRSGVRREIFKYVPLLAVVFGLGAVLYVAHLIPKLWGVP